MSLDRAIASGKERRKAYRRSKSFDAACRNHGSCPYCERNRTINAARIAAKANDHLSDSSSGRALDL